MNITMENFMNAIGIYSYPSYMIAFEDWVENGQSSTTGANDALVHFTKLNLARSRRLEKTIELNPGLKQSIINLKDNYTWMVITEAWCGDSAQILPVIGAMAALNPAKIKLMILLRNEHPGLMDQYLTNGARAIPKVILLNDSTGKEVAVWGPRPAPAQKLLTEWKKNPDGKSWDDFERELHAWYAKDKTQTLQREWEQLMNNVEMEKIGIVNAILEKRA
jgi:hypothetical protein